MQSHPHSLQKKRNRVASTEANGIEPRSKATDILTIDHNDASEAKIDASRKKSRSIVRYIR
jgi:hypothetical protein